MTKNPEWMESELSKLPLSRCIDSQQDKSLLSLKPLRYKTERHFTYVVAL